MLHLRIMRRLVAPLLVCFTVCCNDPSRLGVPQEHAPQLASLVSANASGGVLGTFTLNPPDNSVNGMPQTNTGIQLPLGVAVRVTVSGRMSFSPNPAWPACFGQNLYPPLSLTSVGPSGFPPAADFSVQVGEGSAAGIQPGAFVALGPRDFSSDTAGVDLLGGGGVLWVRRSGVSESCGNTPAYLVSGTQTVVVRVPGAAAVRIRSLAGGFDIRPTGAGDPSALQLEVAVVDDNGDPIPNRVVVLRLDPTEGTAGHAHSGNKPDGGLSSFSPSTGPEGRVTVTYTAPVASGPVQLRASSEGATPDEKTVSVGVLGLEALPPSDLYRLVGATTPHPDNHFGTPAFNAALESLAASFHRVYGLSLEYNDMSLEQGGIFDLNQNWNPPHDEHRVGTNVDLRLRVGDTPLTPRQLDAIRFEWYALSGLQESRAVYDESRTGQPHYHLRFQF
jgi:hypothetical protein